MFLQLFVTKESLVPQQLFTAGLLEFFASFVSCPWGSAGPTVTASKIKSLSVFKGWRSPGLENESQTSAQLRSAEQSEANVAFPGAEQPPTLPHGAFVLQPWSGVIFSTRRGGSVARHV